MRILRDEAGAAPIEGLMGGLLLLAWIMVAYQFYDAFRLRALVGSATYTVADLISRQKGAIGPAFIDGNKHIFDQMTQVHDSSRSWMRVTLVTCPATSTDLLPCDGTIKPFRMDTSYATGTHAALTQADITAAGSRVPVMGAGDAAVVLETFYNYWPIFDIADKTMTLDGQTSFTLGLGSGIVFREFVVTRPRGPHTVWNSSK